MDQVKLIIKKVRKFGFWVLTGLCLLLILALWQTVTSGLTKQFNSRKSGIDGAMSQMQTLSSQADLPTASVVNQTRQAIERQSENVFTAWEVFYNHQKSMNKWPEFDEKYLADFATAGEKRYASGRYPTIRQEALENYRDNIQEHISQLKVKFDIKRPKEDLAATAAAGGRNPADVTVESLRGYQLEGKVFWKDQNFRLLQRRLRWDRSPKTVQVIVAQEDLWVYETLLQVIGKTNGDRSEFNVPIKEIVGIEIAQDAVDTIEKTSERIVSSKELEDYAKSLGMDAGSSEGGVSESSSGTTTEEVLTTDDKIMIQLYDNRYVDKEGKPLTSQQMIDDPPAVEYKLLPIRMNVIINQRYISDLLVHCANAHMPIEVQQLSINPGQAPPFSIKEDDIQIDRARDRSERSRSRDDDDLDPAVRRQNANYLSVLGPEDLELEITGVIYIFNPPDKSKLPGLPENSELGAGEMEEGEPEPEEVTQPEPEPDGEPEPMDEPEEAAITDDEEPAVEDGLDEEPVNDDANPDDAMFE